MYKIPITAHSVEEFKDAEKMLRVLGETACKYACEAKYHPLSYSLEIKFRNFEGSKIELPAEVLEEIKNSYDDIVLNYPQKGYILIFQNAKKCPNISFNQSWQTKP